MHYTKTESLALKQMKERKKLFGQITRQSSHFAF